MYLSTKNFDITISECDTTDRVSSRSSSVALSQVDLLAALNFRHAHAAHRTRLLVLTESAQLHYPPCIMGALTSVCIPKEYLEGNPTQEWRQHLPIAIAVERAESQRRQFSAGTKFSLRQRGLAKSKLNGEEEDSAECLERHSRTGKHRAYSSLPAECSALRIAALDNGMYTNTRAALVAWGRDAACMDLCYFVGPGGLNYRLTKVKSPAGWCNAGDSQVYSIHSCDDDRGSNRKYIGQDSMTGVIQRVFSWSREPPPSRSDGMVWCEDRFPDKSKAVYSIYGSPRQSDYMSPIAEALLNVGIGRSVRPSLQSFDDLSDVGMVDATIPMCTTTGYADAPGSAIINQFDTADGYGMYCSFSYD